MIKDKILFTKIDYTWTNRQFGENEKKGDDMKVFLGGTKGSTWRDQIIPMLNIDYFTPIVDDWTDECKIREIEERQSCDFCLYTITPEMKGVYGIAEAVDDSNKRPKETVLVVLREDAGKRFNDKQWESVCAVAEMIGRNGGQIFSNLRAAADYINIKASSEEERKMAINSILVLG